MGGSQQTFPVTDPPGDGPFDATFSGLDLSGTDLDITLEDENFTASRYLMLSEVSFLGAPITGACCVGSNCVILSETDCIAVKGDYQGDNSRCDPNPCAVYEPDCIIISELIDGTLSGSCPRWIEITNTGDNDFTFPAGGLIVQSDFSSDVFVDVDLTGQTIAAGQSFVINATDGGACTGAFEVTYGFSPDLSVDTVVFGNGNDRYIITDTDDGSNLLDIYGTFGSTGGSWSYEDGYSYRLPSANHGNDGTFAADEWFYGGKNSLEGANPEQLLITLTTPGQHVWAYNCSSPATCAGDSNCDGAINWRDIDFFVAAMNDNVGAWEAMFGNGPSCPFENNDANTDSTVNWRDIDPFVSLMNTTCP
jgi:hypothetical protein